MTLECEATPPHLGWQLPPCHLTQVGVSTLPAAYNLQYVGVQSQVQTVIKGCYMQDSWYSADHTILHVEELPSHMPHITYYVT